MRRAIPFAAAILIALTPRTDGQNSPEVLAARLGSRTFVEREAAAKSLEKLGALALPALRAAYASADLETKRRSLALMERIEDRMMQESVVKPTTVQLSFVDIPVADALRAIEKKMDLRLAHTKHDGVLTLKTGDAPFWRAWSAVGKAARLHEADLAASLAKFKRLRQEDVDQLAQVLQRNRIEVQPVLSLPPINFEKEARTTFAVDDRHSIRVRVRWHALQSADVPGALHSWGIFAVEVRPEPRLHIPRVPRVEITKIIDKDGKETPVKPIQAYPAGMSAEAELLLSAYAGEIQYGGLAHLKTIEWWGPMRSIKEMHGRVRLEMTVRPPLVEIANVFAAVGKEVASYDGVKIKVLEANRKTMQLRVQFNDVDSLTPRTDAEKLVRVRPGVIGVRGPMDVALDRLELRCRAGLQCNRREASYERTSDGNGFVATLRFADPPASGEALNLVLTKAARPILVEMPFIVNDVPVRLSVKD